MANYYAQAILQPANGVAKDVQVNIFAVTDIDVLSTTDASTWNDAIKAFYDACALAGALKDRATFGHIVKYLAIPPLPLPPPPRPPNYPIYERGFALANTPTGAELPQEVSLCVSYANDTASTIPRARRRGRIYISGWSEAANTSGRPTTGVPLALAQAYANYATAVNGIADLTPGVWSRSNGTVYDIQRVFVDNEWDTMRSRGGRSDARSTIVL